MKLKNLCIIAQGGGVRSIYSAGVIKGLLEKFSLIEVGEIVAVSGSAANFMYYTSGQFEEIEKVWTDLIKSKKFIKPFNFFKKEPILNIDFLVDELVRKRFPFNENLFKNSKIKIHIPVLRDNDGENVYFSNRDNVDSFELMRATCAVPYFYGKKVKIDDYSYVDGTMADTFGLNKALELKPENLLVILTEPLNIYSKIPSFLIKRFIELFLKKEPVIVRQKIWKSLINYNNDRKNLLKLKKEINICIIAPKYELPISRLGMSYRLARRTLNNGYKHVLRSKELERFISGIKNK